MYGIDNIDRPQNGIWDLQQKKIWEIHDAGEDVFARIGQILVDEDGTTYIHDTKLKKFFIFNSKGKFIKFFGIKGEAPGEIKAHSDSKMFLLKDKLIINDVDKVNYFTKNGVYLNSVKNNGRKRKPITFLDENNFIIFPIFSDKLKDKQFGYISSVNLKTGKEKNIVKFDLYKGGRYRSKNADLTVTEFGVTPMMTVYYDEIEKKLHFGKNDNYLINTCNLDRKKNISKFSLSRKIKRIPKDYKEKLIKEAPKGIPKDIVKKMVDGLPDYQTQFIHFDIHNGLIYVFMPDLHSDNKKQVDIFSPKGDYLYKTFIHTPDNSILKIKENRSYLIKDGYLYMVVEDEEGEIKILKYRVKLPSLN